ncbi:unnamed protein product [Blepharisma stoltei]|uniref:RRM domain-containing protein n=1 Tax=Blepharisma stoltei TaxID=1481888 RepID=A0AAU9IRA6_9CILI|nr:unnamed protein product [Blepharisma stoltei]
MAGKANAKTIKKQPSKPSAPKKISKKVPNNDVDLNHNRDQNDPLPIPKGDTPYALAKLAEYKERDLDKAEHFYKLTIESGERCESAIKDLASLLHQRGKTQEACDLLDKYRHLFKNDAERFENLYNTLKKQIVTTGNCLNKSLKLSGLKKEDNSDFVYSLFSNTLRILSVKLGTEEIGTKEGYYAILEFSSHSSARKTLEGFHHWDEYKIEWIDYSGEVAGDAHYARHKMEEYRKHHPTFEYKVFDRDPKGYVLSMPIDGIGLKCREMLNDDEFNVKQMLGFSLFSTIFEGSVN